MSLDEERARFWNAIEANSARLDGLERDMHHTVTRAVQEAMPNGLLNAEEYRWVQLAIRKEAQSIAFRQSVIDKGLTMFLLGLAGGFFLVIKEYLAAHGWKP